MSSVYPVGPIIPHRGATAGTHIVETETRTGYRNPPGPRDGFIIAFGPIDGVTSRRVLSKTFFFQVPPLNQFPADWAWVWNDYGTIGSGMHSNPNYSQLATYSFDSCFVLDDAVNQDLVLVHDDDSIFERIRLLRNLGDSMKPFAMQVGSASAWNEWEPLGRKQQAQVAVTLRSFHVETRAGEPDTRYFTLNLTEFPDAPALSKIVAPKTVAAIRPGSRSTSRDKVTDSKGHQVYLLDPRDLTPDYHTLHALAKAYYRDASMWIYITKANAPNLDNISPSADLRVKLAERRVPVKIRIPQVPQTTPGTR